MHPSSDKIPVTQLSDPPLPGNGKFHVRLVEGFYQNLRRLISWPLIGLFFGLGWVRIDGQPLVMFDFAAHRIFLFGAELSWYDLPILAGLMIAGASLLFFMAVGWGRVWCGFACPQSIWTWIFIRIEQFTEGRASQRAKQDAQSFTPLRLLRRGLKHLIWLLVALITALSFSAYFVPIETLLSDLIHARASWFSISWLTVMTLLTYLNAGLVREKVCLHMCPYSRFQGVMFDPDTRTVSYDQQRGEPRRDKHHPQSAEGDCVDCGICVQVCPTGIDIRNGLQAACIDCAACIDACDQVMDKLGRDRGLIGFYSEQQLNTTMLPRQEEHSPMLRPRLLGYLSVLVVTLWAVVYGLGQRTDLLIEIARERGELYQMEGNRICNRYRVELERFNPDLKQLQLAVRTAEPGLNLTVSGPLLIDLQPGNRVIHYQLCSQKAPMQSRNQIHFEFNQAGFIASKESTFLAP
ncbi:cytochrome c oxidase accessory protein CcoG [Neptuniibacter halophilus]|uniref:cytochrome c oxidase accessory protein CcoG n=1 Tax=Neptuniibacter halophilus TaxID=651666 RepID=UPI0025727FFB|nr:cytochrome c oxidase accessory protein CcoG [Neptuniibacter halophilus]